MVAVVVALAVLAPAATGFDDRLVLVLVCLGLPVLGAGFVLLADEVRERRASSRSAGVRSSSAEVVAGLVNGLTPARLLVLTGAFVLLLAAYVARGG